MSEKTYQVVLILLSMCDWWEHLDRVLTAKGKLEIWKYSQNIWKLLGSLSMLRYSVKMRNITLFAESLLAFSQKRHMSLKTL